MLYFKEYAVVPFYDKIIRKLYVNNIGRFAMTIEEYLQRYRENGYIQELRKYVGHAPIMSTAGGIIIENENGEILLQKRKDNSMWGIIGGAMEIGESIQETVRREAFEEAGIRVSNMDLFGIYTGEDRLITYPNGDVCFVTSIVFITSTYEGSIVDQESEVIEHRFFSSENIPNEINDFDRVYISDWISKKKQVIVR